MPTIDTEALSDAVRRTVAGYGRLPHGGDTAWLIRLGHLGEKPVRETVHSLLHEVYTAGRAHLSHVDQAAKAPGDPHMSAEFNQALRSEVLTALNRQFADQMGDHRDAFETLAKQAAAAAEPHRLKVDSENLAQITRTDQAWRNSIVPQLEAGKAWDQIVESLDADGILAVKRFAPTHEVAKRSQLQQHEVPGVLAGIARLLAKREVAVAPEEVRGLLLTASEAETKGATGRGWIAQLSEVTPRNSVAVSLNLERSGKALGAHQPTLPETAAL